MAKSTKTDGDIWSTVAKVSVTKYYTGEEVDCEVEFISITQLSQNSFWINLKRNDLTFRTKLTIDLTIETSVIRARHFLNAFKADHPSKIKPGTKAIVSTKTVEVEGRKPFAQVSYWGPRS
jgi:hypothetical protein